MKRLTATFLFFFLILTCSTISFAGEDNRIELGNLILENVPDIPAAVSEAVRRRQGFRSAEFLDWIGDGTAILIATRFGTTTQIHRVAAPLGARYQLTFSAEPLNSAVARPGGDGFVYPKDEGGNEYYQLYFHSMTTGEAVRLTDGKNSRNLGAIWSKDGKQLAYLHSPEGTNRSQVHLMQMPSITDAKIILDREGAWSIEDWSADGKTLLMNRYVSMTESYIYTLSVENGQLREINPQPANAPRIAYNGGQYPQLLGGLTGGPPRGGRFSADGKSVYVISDQDSQFARLIRIDLPTGKRTVIAKDPAWDVEGFDLSPNGHTLVYSVNQEGFSKLHALDTLSGAVLDGPLLPLGIVGNRGFDPQGQRFAFTLFSASGPADVYVWSMDSHALARWSESEMSAIDPAVLTEPELVHFPSFDKRTLSAFLYRPKREGKLPVIIHIHGGPEAQFRPAFSPFGPVISGLQLGFAVIAPNVRGSTGYGKSFTALDNGIRREDAVKDIGALLDWISKQPFLDKDRVVVHGGSYGGYMVNACMIHFTDRLKAAVSIVAISDLDNFLRNTAPYRRDLRRAEYGDERDPNMAAFFKRISPLDQAQRITAPMFIVHGTNDPRVPVTEAEQLFSALKANGEKPWLMIAKDEGHGFQKQENIIRLEEAMILFLQDVVLEADKKPGTELRTNVDAPPNMQ